MKSFRGFVAKEFLHIVRDRRTLVILIGMPIAQLVLFGFAIRNEVNDVRLGIVDLSRDQVTQEIVSRILASPYFVGVESLSSEQHIEAAFKSGRIKEAVVFEPDFASRMARDGVSKIRVVADATDPNVANTVVSYTSAIVQRYQLDQLAQSAVGAGIRSSAAQSAIQVDVRMRYNPELKSVYLFVPGLIALVLMLVCALMTSVTITREKEIGTMEVLLVSPLRPYQIIVGKVLPYLALSMVIVLVILGLARTVFAVPIRGSITLLLLECALFTACALGLGIMISTRAATQQTATMVSLAGLLLPTVILSGFIFPVASMPTPLQFVSHIIPAKWFLIIIRRIMIKGVGIEYFWKETLILAGMTTLLLVVSVRNFKDRLEG